MEVLLAARQLGRIDAFTIRVASHYVREESRNEKEKQVSNEGREPAR